MIIISSGVFKGGVVRGPLWCEKFFRRFITNKLKIYEFVLCY